MDNKMNQKKIMLLVPLLDQGGLERVCALTAKLLNEKYELCLVVFSTKNMLYDVSGIELIDLNLESRPGRIGKIINVFKRIRAVKKVKKQKHIEITYSFGPTANIVNIWSRVRDQIWVGIRAHATLRSGILMKMFCKRADKVICCSEVIAEEVREAYHPKDVVCLHNPCDLDRIAVLKEATIEERYRDFLTGEAQILASMSRADDIKGYWHLLKGFSLLQKKMPNTKLMIIGDGDFSEYVQLAKDLGIEKMVLFTGLKKNPFCYLNQADLYVATSNTEGFPNSLLEAMAVGLPVIAANCKTGPAEILSDDFTKVRDASKVYEAEYGVLMSELGPGRNTDATVIEEGERILAIELEKLLRDEKKLQDLRKRAFNRSKHFSTDNYLKHLCKLIEEV
ncbi:MAG: glycosyltransferase [Lachnospiraceae bacterium]